MTDISVALIQHDICWGRPSATLKSVEPLVAKAAGKGAQLVVLPEMFATGFNLEPSLAEGSNEGEEPEGVVHQFIKRVAREHELHIVAGCMTRTKGDIFNSALVVSPEGAVIAHYAKQKMFAFGGEHQVVRPGNQGVRFSVNGVRFGLFICYDLRFPELFRKMARFTDAAVVIASWPMQRRAHWLSLLKARAIENQQYVLGVNRIGRGGGLVYGGDSRVFGPDGCQQQAVDDETSVLLGIVCSDTVRHLRSTFPFLADM